MRVPEQIGISANETIVLAYTVYRGYEGLPPYTVRDLRDDVDEYSLPNTTFTEYDETISRIMRKLSDRGDIFPWQDDRSGRWGNIPKYYEESDLTEVTLAEVLQYRLEQEKFGAITDGTFAARYLGLTVVVASICENFTAIDEDTRNIIAVSVK